MDRLLFSLPYFKYALYIALALLLALLFVCICVHEIFRYLDWQYIIIKCNLQSEYYWKDEFLEIKGEYENPINIHVLLLNKNILSYYIIIYFIVEFVYLEIHILINNYH